jgi:hypothetical protein
MADRPVFFSRLERTAEDTLRSVQRYQAADHARRLEVPPVGHERLGGVNLCGVERLPADWHGRSFAETFESVAKKSAVGTKRVHV